MQAAENDRASEWLVKIVQRILPWITQQFGSRVLLVKLISHIFSQPKRAVPREEAGNPTSGAAIQKIFIGGIKDKPITKVSRSLYYISLFRSLSGLGLFFSCSDHELSCQNGRYCINCRMDSPHRRQFPVFIQSLPFPFYRKILTNTSVNMVRLKTA